jgi:enediyne biosynthesis protein CalE5
MTTTSSGFTTTGAHDWSDVAAAWDAHRADVERTGAETTLALLAGLALQPGDRVLELGGGTGELAVQLAAAVRPGGHVLATDVAEGMVELIRRTTADLAEVEVAQLDANDIDVPAASYDAVVFRMGLMLLTEPQHAVAGMHRAVKPGGRIAVTTWGGFAENPWLTCVGMAAMANGLVSSGPPIAPGGVLSLGDPAQVESLARDAGFTDVTITPVDVTFQAEDIDRHLGRTSALAGPLAAAFAAATPEQLAGVRRTASDLSAQYADADGRLAIPGRALLLLATK